MTTLIAPPTPAANVGELLERLGNVPPHRVRMRPPLGMATERDVLDVHARDQVLCELIEGTLVEKAMELRESAVAMFLGQFLGVFVHARQLGFLTGEAGMMRL